VYYSVLCLSGGSVSVCQAEGRESFKVNDYRSANSVRPSGHPLDWTTKRSPTGSFVVSQALRYDETATSKVVQTTFLRVHYVVDLVLTAGYQSMLKSTYRRPVA
jgi:hypothetical protein